MFDENEIMARIQKEMEGLSEEQRRQVEEYMENFSFSDLFANAEAHMLNAFGVQNADELRSLSQKELKKRSKEMNKKLMEQLRETQAFDDEEFEKPEPRPKRTRNPQPSLIPDDLLPFVKNTVVCNIAEEAQGISKIGGKPLLPEGFEWPRNEYSDPLSFLLQINFAEVHPFDKDNLFPDHGMLYIFYDVNEQPWDSEDGDGKGYAVYYYTGELSILSPVDYPEEKDPDDVSCGGYADENCLIYESPLTFSSSVDLPSYEDLCYICDKVKYESEEYEDIRSEITDTFPDDDVFKLGGYPDTIQDGLFHSFEPDGYTMLCQLSTYEAPGAGFMFGDGGRLFVMIKTAGLAAGDFSDAEIELQCY